MSNSVVLLSLSIDELKEIIREAVKQELNLKKENELMNFRETCNYLGCSASALNNWKSKNIIPYKKIGKRVMFSRKEVKEALKDSNFMKLRQLE